MCLKCFSCWATKYWTGKSISVQPSHAWLWSIDIVSNLQPIYIICKYKIFLFEYWVPVGVYSPCLMNYSKIGSRFIYFRYSCLDKWTLYLHLSLRGNEPWKFSLKWQWMRAQKKKKKRETAELPDALMEQNSYEEMAESLYRSLWHNMFWDTSSLLWNVRGLLPPAHFADGWGKPHR